MIIAFIGGGNMATALISGLAKSRDPGLQIRVADPSEEARLRLQSAFRLIVSRTSREAVKGADIVVLAIKPQVVPTVLAELAGALQPEQLVLSIAAGTTIQAIARQLGPRQAIIRSMPNTPALVGAGISAMCAGENCRPHHREQAERVLRAAGSIVWVSDEALMDAVTAVSGSGPAYFFLLAETLAAAGARLGLPAEVSRQLAEATCAGAGAMLSHSADDAAELRRRVTSPGGTTQAALDAFERGNFSALVFEAVAAAERRGKELAVLSGQAGSGAQA
jgi:pyrroline-5-carboxylate reductase